VEADTNIGRARRCAALRRALRELTPSTRWPEPLLVEEPGESLRAALQEELAEGDAASLDAERIAAVDEELDILVRRALERLERIPDSALRSPPDDRTGPPAAEESPPLRVLLTVATLGWALRAPETEPALRELGVDPTPVRERWLAELEGWVHARTGALLTAGRYEPARALSDLKILCLAPLRSEGTEPLPGAPSGAPGSSPRAGAPPGTRTARGSRPAAEAWRAPSPRPEPGAEALPEAPPRELSPESGRRRVRRALALALTAAGVATGAWWLQPGSGSVEILGERELAALSTHLEAGYRDVRGPRSIFIGTTAPSWERLAPEQRMEEARALERRLAGGGVEEVMLFDRRHRLELHLGGRTAREGRPQKIM